MNKTKILAIGDNVADKYLSRGLMYPGGQCINTCVYAIMNDAQAAYLGKFGNDAVAIYNQKILTELNIDYSHSRHFEGENGYARVTLENNDRVFLGSNKGGVAKEYPYDFNDDDLQYIKGFDLVYTNLNSYIEKDLPLLHDTRVPIVYDFSTRWNDKYLETVCPYIKIATLSCAHLDDSIRQLEMKKTADLGVKIVLGTVGEDGSYLLYDDRYYYQPACKPKNVKDTMGAGDAYFAAFLVTLLGMSQTAGLYEGNMEKKLIKSMETGAKFAAKVCEMEGAFGYGIPITE
jgi:sugar/nucleoside kinase (ribokinase family)